MTLKDDWDSKYHKPVVEDRIVGFSGLDPQSKYSEEDKKAIAETVEEVVEEKAAAIVEEKIGMIVDIQVGD